MAVENLKTNLITTASDFQRKAAKVMADAADCEQPVAVLSHSKLMGYYVPASVVQKVSKSSDVTVADISIARKLMSKYSDRLESLSKR